MDPHQDPSEYTGRRSNWLHSRLGKRHHQIKFDTVSHVLFLAPVHGAPGLFLTGDACRSSSGTLAMLTAIRRASSQLIQVNCRAPRPGSSSNRRARAQILKAKTVASLAGFLPSVSA
jgi:hypothetical protein